MKLPSSPDLVELEPVTVEPCVYFLIDGDEVVYVGSTINRHSRIAAHRSSKTFDRAVYLRVTADSMLEVESSFIRAMLPVYNTGLLPSKSTKYDGYALAILGLEEMPTPPPKTKIFKQNCVACGSFREWTTTHRSCQLMCKPCLRSRYPPLDPERSEVTT